MGVSMGVSFGSHAGSGGRIFTGIRASVYTIQGHSEELQMNGEAAKMWFQASD